MNFSFGVDRSRYLLRWGQALCLLPGILLLIPGSGCARQPGATVPGGSSESPVACCSSPDGCFTNPIRPGADPFLVRYHGRYYLTTTPGRNLLVWSAPTLEGLRTARGTEVWKSPDTGPESQHVWAPELHFLDRHWYLYYAADAGKDRNHRIFVLESRGDDPLGPYIDRGEVTDITNQWAIDPTVLEFRGKRYLVWSGRDHWEGPQSIYLARLGKPWQVIGPRVRISTPEYDWEKHGWWVNEGPEVLEHRGKLFIVYSASGGTTPYYCLGLLELHGKDPLDAGAWTKFPNPIFAQYQGPDGAVYGPGHCGFFRSPDRRQDWIIYHGKDTPENTWAGRTVRAQAVRWNPDGTPNLGHPIPPGVPVPRPSGEQATAAAPGERATVMPSPAPTP